MAAPASAFTDIATLWQRGFVRCILTGDGTVCALVLMDDHRMVRTVPMPDELTAIGAARAWLRDHQDLAILRSSCGLPDACHLRPPKAADHLARKMFDHTCDPLACGVWTFWPSIT
jgi:hypothetical protein